MEYKIEARQDHQQQHHQAGIIPMAVRRPYPHPGPRRAVLVVLAFSLGAAWPGSAGVEALHAEYRCGQVFLVWQERDLPEPYTLNVYAHAAPITAETLASARRVGYFVEPHSARDWTKDPAVFEPDGAAAAPVGFRIRAGAARLDPHDGLFVYTVRAGDPARGYYAVVVARDAAEGASVEDTTLVPGANTLTEPVAQSVAPVQPVWDGDGDPPTVPAGLPLVLVLHSRRGGRHQAYYDRIVFADATQGWREGLAHMFRVEVGPDAVRIMPSDRVWNGRGRAFHSFWYGYHSRIYSARAMREGGAVVNYGERRLLWLMDWAGRELETDPDRVYLTGSSMGGCGSVSMALHHAARIAAVYAHVPVVSYTPSVPGYERGTDWRITAVCGPLKGEAPTNDDGTVLERMNGAARAAAAADLPFIYLCNGRRDRSIPWYNNPPFYRAMEQAKHGFAAYWDNGEHGTAGRAAPSDVLAWRDEAQTLLRFRRNASFPGFTGCSDNRDAGNGQIDDGDIIGWINRGLDWTDIVDEADRYAVSIAARYDGIAYPVTIDLTPRRVQRFRVAPGQAAQVTVDGVGRAPVTADARGLVTVPRIELAGPDWLRIELRR